MEERLGIAGAGTIACGLAATASCRLDVLLYARSPESAERAQSQLEKACGKLEDGNPERIRVVTDLDALREATFLVEAIIEHHGHKAEMLADLGEIARHAGNDAVLATTTSSLSISELSRASGHPERFVALHVFNPVPRMELVELAFPPEATSDARGRARALCEALGKTPVEVPDIPGFVVNRLLFPYLFSAVDLLAETGMDPQDIDSCMTLGAGMPMGPIALLDFVGLDVAQAIGQALDVAVPQSLGALVEEGALGRKAGRGFYSYD
ncbi:MAG: 3-hydroxyacyl-CoA dehydrogenase family protein [Solirubrobacteraceae bacterium]